MVGTGGVDFKRCLTVHPVVGTAETGSFGTHRTNVIGGKRLAQGAGIINLFRFIRHVLNPFVPMLVLCPGPFGQFVHIFFLGVEGDLDFIQNFFKILMELGVKDDAEMLQAETLFHG